MKDTLELPPGSSSTLLEWRVLMGPLDDWPNDRPSAEDQTTIIEECVRTFRNKLISEHRKGVLPIGYGPIS